MLTIRHPTLHDADALLAFEIDNRAYFEHWINARPADYYSPDAVSEALTKALDDIGKDRAYHFERHLHEAADAPATGPAGANA